MARNPNAPPCMPFFVDDYEAATTHLTIEQDGAYCRLLRLCWRSADGTIPADPDWIMRHLRVTADEYQRSVAPVIGEYFSRTRGKGARLMQKRLMRERTHVRRNSIKASDSAKSRWNKEKDTCVRNAPYPTLPIPKEKEESRVMELPLTGQKPPGQDRHGASARADAPGAMFLKFWSAYPKRAGGNPRKTALAAFERAVRRGIDPAVMIAGAARYAEWCASNDRAGTQFVAQAVTWIGQERWTDVLTDERRSPVFDRGTGIL